MIRSGPATTDDLVRPSMARIATPAPARPRIHSQCTSGSQPRLSSSQAKPTTTSITGKAASFVIAFLNVGLHYVIPRLAQNRRPCQRRTTRFAWPWQKLFPQDTVAHEKVAKHQ